MDTNNEVRFDPMTGEPIKNKNEEENHGFDPMTGEPLVRIGFDPMTGEPVYGTKGTKIEDTIAKTNSTNRKKQKFPLGGKIVAVSAVILVVAAVLFLKGVGRLGLVDTEKMLVYQKNGTIYYVPNMDKADKQIEVDSNESEYTYSFELTPSGKYLYYCTEDDRRTLYRAELGKLKSDTDKNDKYITEIGNNVYEYKVMEEEYVVYRSDNEDLSYYNGKEDYDIDQNVERYEVGDDGYIYYKTNKTGEYQWRYYNVRTTESDTYARDVNMQDYNAGTGEILVRDGDAFYTISKDGKETKVVDDVDNMVSVSLEDKVVYFTRERTEKHNLYEYVDDPYAGSEDGMKEPEMMDFAHEISEEMALSSEDIEYLQEYPEYEYNFYDYYVEWDEEYGIRSYYNSDIGKSYYYDGDNDSWYDIDIAEYESACEEYYNIENRVSIREKLKETDFEISCHDLYMCRFGADEVLLSKNVNKTDFRVDCAAEIAVYGKTATSENLGKVEHIDNIYDVYEFENRMRRMLDSDYYDSDYYDSDYEEDDEEGELNQNRETIYICLGEKEFCLDEDGTFDKMQVSPDGKFLIVYMIQDEKYACCYNIAGGELKKIWELEDDILSGNWSGNCYYYIAGDDEEGDLIKFENGKSETILKNITPCDIKIDKDERIFTHNTDYDRELRVYNHKGDYKEIENNIQEYSCINPNRIVYIKNDSLWVYNGDEDDARVARNVESGCYSCYSEDAVSLIWN